MTSKRCAIQGAGRAMRDARCTMRVVRVLADIFLSRHCAPKTPHPESGIPHLASRNARHAFTLIELVAVVAILGVLASVVTFSVGGHIQHARLIGTADRLESLDRRVRDEARRRSAPGQLLWDLRQGMAWIRFNRAGVSHDSTRRVTLGRGVQMTEILIGGRRGRGRQAVDVSPIGQSDTYAVRLAAPNGAFLWLVTLGRSGQHLRFESEDDVRAFLAP